MMEGALKSNADNDWVGVLLSLVKTEQTLRNSMEWKTNTERAVERHGDACDALWEYLYDLLKKYPETTMSPPSEAALRTKIRAEERKNLVDHLRRNLLTQIMDSLEDYD